MKNWASISRGKKQSGYRPKTKSHACVAIFGTKELEIGTKPKEDNDKKKLSHQT